MAVSEDLGGGDLHGRKSGVVDHVADNDEHALSIVRDIVSTLQSYHAQVDVHDPWVDASESELLITEAEADRYDAVIIAVAHEQFIAMGIEALKAFGKSTSVIFDVKHLFPSSAVDGSL